MKFILRRAAAIVLAAALSFPAAANFATSPDRNRERDKSDLVLRVIQQIKKIFGVAANADIPVPPYPPPPPTP